MNSIIKQALQLPKGQKLELLYALQQELKIDDEVMYYSDELINELRKREKVVEDGTASLIPVEEFNSRLENLRNELRSKRS